MPVEAVITRALEVRFIDARMLATEAKSNLGIQAYPTKEQEQMILKEAIHIFVSRPLSTQREMKRQNEILEAATHKCYSLDHSIHKKKGDDHSSSSGTNATDATTLGETPEDMKMVQAQCCVIL
uniref:Uncharacterized protein n=1 Tax=Craspedostauros australis TaxID=1486917 RepID=A0A7R9ZTF6_9STRA|mmetsp:Transcript_972/g.2810  ORF Transcript_972/g.2810 Transcript_972/m.2810 type:complete len:124 (+) Transcript_972:139-510(+)|eukprot:CAMPEP_0198113814 /NCGR_PEP_ID=MMETSP1442-20131203/5387_1 /TAXON_ID= /ORGANISM="Craspedostauros australis, Strain CCMP3328" /LENGTH=123 /DNA_ID=CAMNT_0043770999 /DNA_START=106 /DNA_END=477 /DNA_ORIENTATION=-